MVQHRFKKLMHFHYENSRYGLCQIIIYLVFTIIDKFEFFMETMSKIKSSAFY